MTPQQIKSMKQALEKIATVNAMDYEYQAWAREALAQTQEPVSNDPLPRACNLAGVDYQTFLKIKAYMPVAPPQRTEQEPVAWLLTDKNINSLQVDSIQRLIDRLKHAHHTDIRVRINGHDEWFEADWLKHMVRVTPPQRTWVKLMRGVRVEGDSVVILVKGGNEAARELCNELLKEKNT